MCSSLDGIVYYNRTRMRILKHLYRIGSGGGGNEGAAVSRQVESVGAQLWEVKNLAEGAAVVMTLFAKGLARRLAAPVVVANVNRPSHALRVDSVVAIVLLVWFSSEIQADVLVLQILASLTIAR